MKFKNLFSPLRIGNITVKNSDGTTQMNHPYSSGNMGIMNYMAEDDWDFFSYFDTIEVWNGYFIVPDGRFTSKTSESSSLRIIGFTS